MLHRHRTEKVNQIKSRFFEERNQIKHNFTFVFFAELVISVKLFEILEIPKSLRGKGNQSSKFKT